MDNIVLHARENESMKDFINRISQMARAFDKNVDGSYRGVYVADISPQDEPEKVYQAFEQAERMFRQR